MTFLKKLSTLLNKSADKKSLSSTSFLYPHLRKPESIGITTNHSYKHYPSFHGNKNHPSGSFLQDIDDGDWL